MINLDPNKVQTGRTFVALITGIGADETELRDNETVFEDDPAFVNVHIVPKANPENEFDVLELRLTYRELLPRESDRDKTMTFRIDRADDETIRAGGTPTPNVRRPLGKLMKDLKTLGLPAANSDELIGEVVVVRQYDDEFNGYTTTRFDIIAHLGDRLNWNRDKAEDYVGKVRVAA